MQQRQRVNDAIGSSRVLLIDESGNNIGDVARSYALNLAKQAGLDLVEINSGNKGLPVCKIMDFGKFKYEKSKKSKKNKVQKKTTKEVKFRPNTGDNDLAYRAKHVKEFLSDGHKVKLVVRFRGRELEHMYETGKVLLQKFLSLLDELNIDFIANDVAKAEGRSIVLLISSENKK